MTQPRNAIGHFVMNLPDSAISFLDAFRGLFQDFASSDAQAMGRALPMIHCHCFTRELEPDKAEKDIRQVYMTFGNRLSDADSY